MTVRSRGEGLIAGRVALHPSSFECPAFMIKKICVFRNGIRGLSASGGGGVMGLVCYGVEGTDWITSKYTRSSKARR
jgi:hypothetical protein